MRFAILLLMLCSLSSADEMSLVTLRASVVARRGQPDVEPRGATEQLTVVKHQLRDWFESRLAGFGQHGDEGEFERKLNAELREAGLSCDDENANARLPCPDRDLSGFLGDLTVRRSHEFLILTTGAGIVCGYDHSAYIYRWLGEKWTRIWQNEQNTYTEKDYAPQNLHAVLISHNYSSPHDYVVLTLGSYPWCSSNWQGVYYRLFPLGRDLEPAPIVNGDELAYVGKHDPPIQGSATPDDLLVEFTVGSLDDGVGSREAIRHYKIEGGSARRTDPLALSPRDFVDEWLTTDWKESASWSEPTNRSSMKVWRQRLRHAPTEFMFPTMHCLQRPDLWQVALDSSGTQSTQKPTYFLVRWRPPYRFRMVSVGDKPWPGCTEKDAAADQDRTLFPVQDWR